MSDEPKDADELPNTPPNYAADPPRFMAEKRKIFFGLFVFPMLIAVTMALLLSGIVLLTHEDETPETLITAIKTGAPSKRWQKAFELSNELNREGGLLRGTGIMNEVIHILNDSEHYDAKTRAYMAMALSRFQNPKAEDALMQALRKVDDSDDPQLALFLMWALGNLTPHLHPPPALAGGGEEGGEVARFLDSSHDDLRKASAYVLGAIYGTRYVTGQVHVPAVPATVVNQLRRALEDPVVDVRWNAALSLARLGDRSGGEVLLQMLDRKHLSEVARLDEVETERVMVNAAKALGLILDSETRHILEQLAAQDPSLKVRQVAMEALKHPSLRGRPTDGPDEAISDSPAGRSEIASPLFAKKRTNPSFGGRGSQ